MWVQLPRPSTVAAERLKYRGKQWLIQRGDRGDMSTQISGREGVMQKCLPPFYTQRCNSRFYQPYSRLTGLGPYACKTDSSTAIKLAPRMHQNLSFSAQKSKKISREGHRPLPRWGGNTPPHTQPLGASFLALAIIRPAPFKPWIRPCGRVRKYGLARKRVSGGPAVAPGQMFGQNPASV